MGAASGFVTAAVGLSYLIRHRGLRLHREGARLRLAMHAEAMMLQTPPRRFTLPLDPRGGDGLKVKANDGPRRGPTLWKRTQETSVIRSFGLALVAAVMLAAAPLTALAAPAPAAPDMTINPDAHAQGKKEAPDALKAANFPCTMTDAYFIGSAPTKDEAGKPTTLKLYELPAQAHRPGHLLHAHRRDPPLRLHRRRHRAHPLPPARQRRRQGDRDRAGEADRPHLHRVGLPLRRR